MSLPRVPQTLMRRTKLTPRLQVRRNTGPSGTGGRENLGGPGGQQRPSASPGGPEALRKNWVPIGGAAFAIILAAYFYNSNKKSAFEKAQQEAKMRAKQSMDEMSGKSQAGQGAFRSE